MAHSCCRTPRSKGLQLGSPYLRGFPPHLGLNFQPASGADTGVGEAAEAAPLPKLKCVDLWCHKIRDTDYAKTSAVQ